MSSKLNVNFVGAATPGGEIKFTDPIGVATFTSLDFNVKSITVGTGATIFNPADNILTLGTNDEEHIRINSNGGIGIATVAALGATLEIADLGSTGPTLLLSGGTATEGDIVVPTGQNINIGHWGSSTFDEKVRITNDGNIGIGTTSPENDVHVMAGSATMKVTSTTSGSSSRLILESENDSYGGVHFGDPEDEDVGRIRYYHGGSNPNTLWFSTVAQARVAINAEGKVGIGTDGMGTDSLCSDGGVDICSRGYTGEPSLVVGADNSAQKSQSRNDTQQKDARIGMPHYTNSEECPCIVSAFATSDETSVRLGGGTSYLNSATNIRFYTEETNTTLGDADKYRVAIHEKGLYELRAADGSTTSRGWRQAFAHKAWDTDDPAALFDLHMVGGFGSAHLLWEIRDSSAASTGGSGVRIGEAWVCFRGSGNDITSVNVATNTLQSNTNGTLADMSWSAAVQDTSTIRLTATSSADSSSVSIYLWGSSPHFATDNYGISAV